MTTIAIREVEQTETGFKVSVSFGGSGNFPATIALAPQDEKLWEWYFEEWLVHPMTEITKSDRAVESIKNYGEQLFQQVFADRNAYAKYVGVRDNSSQLQITIESQNPEFQALHWEALRDPDRPRPLAVDCVMTRKSVGMSVVPTQPIADSPLIKVLLVTARPYKDDVAYRTISRTLIAAIENSSLRIQVDLLRPGTYTALAKQLEEKGRGYYHIIHFDTHGALLTYDQLTGTPPTQDSYTYKRYGRRSEIARYSGKKAFLVLEGENLDQEDLVEATELANLLTGKQIPVCILNACQSGKQLSITTDQDEYRETSLGSRLMAAGMQMVVAMSYSVTVTAAEITIAEFYKQLFQGKTLEESIRRSRWELHNQKERCAHYGYEICLEDWLLPVVYANQEVRFALRQFTPQEEEDYYRSLETSYHFREPTYGFIGRDLDILQIEKALFHNNMLLVQGMGGTGKTTLLNHLREWWQKTHFVDRIFYFGYDEKAWTRDQILFVLGSQVYDRFEADRFQSMEPDAQVGKMVQFLRSQNYILILDNLESVTGEPLAIANTLDQPDQTKLKNFLSRLSGGKTRIIFGSRCGETWLQSGTFKNNILHLRGLDRESRTFMAERILQTHVPHKAADLQKTKEFSRLMNLLAGYPLALEVVLPNLKSQTPKEVLSALLGADIDLDRQKNTDDKTKSILKCVEYSHSNLSPQAQKLLLCLAPFSNFIFRPTLSSYAQQLQQLAPWQNYDLQQLDAALEEAIHWGLLAPMNDEKQLLSVQPVFPYFLKTKLAQLDADTRQSLDRGFRAHYRTLAELYENAIYSKDAQERQRGLIFCRLEYENLYRALENSIDHQESIGIFFCLDKYLNQDKQSRCQLAEKVNQALAAYPPQLLAEEMGGERVRALGQLGYSYVEVQAYDKARATYGQALELCQHLPTVAETTVKSWLAATYHQLGMVAQEQRDYEGAHHYYQQALAIKVEYNDRYSQGRTYHQLGKVAEEQRDYEGAHHYYQQALAICVEYNDRYNQAFTYHNLGMVAQAQRDYEGAHHYYQQALAILVEYNDRYSQASTYHQLGRVAEEQRDYEGAHHYYQQALAIWVEYNDRYEQAGTYHSLGSVAEDLEDFPTALSHFLQALQLWLEFNDTYSIETYSLPALVRLYEVTQDTNFLVPIAQLYDVTVEEVIAQLVAQESQ